MMLHYNIFITTLAIILLYILFYLFFSCSSSSSSRSDGRVLVSHPRLQARVGHFVRANHTTRDKTQHTASYEHLNITTMPIFDDVPLSDGEEEALLHLNVQGETTGVKDEAAPHLEACPLVMGDDVGLSHVDDLLDSNDMLMAVMQTDMMELENTGEPAMDDFQEHFHAVVNRESGVLAFYIPSVNVVEPGVVSQLVAAIEAGDRKLRLKLETGPHPQLGA